MQKCDNCKAEFSADAEGILTLSRGKLVAAICGGCYSNARTVKLVLKRRDVGGFAYEQFQAIEMIKAAG